MVLVRLPILRARVKALAEATSHSVKMVLVAEPRTWRAEYGAEHLLKELEQLAAFTRSQTNANRSCACTNRPRVEARARKRLRACTSLGLKTKTTSNAQNAKTGSDDILMKFDFLTCDEIGVLHETS